MVKLCDQAYQKIEETRNLNAFITLKSREEALQEAEKLDKEYQNVSAEDYPLYGVPISIKDNFCTSQMLTTCGSRMLHNYIPPYDATIVKKLKQSRCLITGKTNMDEFAMGSSCTTSYYGMAANPLKMELMQGKLPMDCDPNNWYMAGGSSTGSAISVASGACFASIGTDTGGSTRQPASLTGIVGFKPTYGLISRFGLVPLAHCLDVVSLLARSVEDIECVFNLVIGQDENDLTTVDHKKELKTNIGNLKGQTIRVGIPEKFVSSSEMDQDVSDQYQKLIESLSHSDEFEGTKFQIVKIDLPHSDVATECYTIITSSEISSNMSCYDGIKYGYSTEVPQEFDRDDFFKANRDAAFGLEVKKRILLGNYFVLEDNRDKYLVHAQKVRTLISQDFSNVFERDGCHVILLPSTPTTSITYDEWLSKQDENKLFREDYFLIPANLANCPSISLPSGPSPKSGLPIGMQLVANKFHDLDLLKIAKFMEQNVFCETKRPGK